MTPATPTTGADWNVEFSAKEKPGLRITPTFQKMNQLRMELFTVRREQIVQIPQFTNNNFTIRGLYCLKELN